MVEKLGIFGGTFDPPHIGHQILAAEALFQLELDKVLWVLTPDPPHKHNKTITPLPIRLEMVQAATAIFPGFDLSWVEMDRPPPHYAVDTVQLLKERYPEAQLIYLMGGDSLGDIPTWYTPQKFVAICDAIGVMRRPGDKIDLGWLESQIPGIAPKVQFLETPLIEIAASQIRSRIRQGKPFRFFLPQSVYKIIRENGLYLEPGDSFNQQG